MPTSDFADTSEWTPGSRAAELNSADPTSSQFSMATRIDSGLENTPLDSEFEITSDGDPATPNDRSDSNIGKLLRFKKEGQEQILKLTALIGIGGMGKVYEATSLTHPREKTVAVKVAKKSKNGEKIQRRLRQESEILGSMEHRHIVHFIGSGNTDGGAKFIVMERIYGLNAVEFVHRYGYSLQQRLQLFLKICEAVSYCHHHGIIHRDIKPGNVLVNEITSEPVLIDFGIAKLKSQTIDQDKAELTSDNHPTEKTDAQLIGTIQYMSPEQAMQDEYRVDHRSDIYSLGALLYEMLSGTPLIDQQTFEKRTLEDIVSTIASQRKTLSLNLKKLDADQSELVSCLEWILDKAIQNDPVDRFENVDEFSRELKTAMNGPKSFINKLRPTVASGFSARSKPALKKQSVRKQKRLSRAHMWQAISLCLVVATVIAFGMNSFVECPSAKNSKQLMDKHSVLESLYCDSQEALPEIRVDGLAPKFHQVDFESIHLKPVSQNTFAFQRNLSEGERRYKKLEISDKTRRILIRNKTKVQWLTNCTPCYSIEVARELPNTAQKQAIVRFQQVVDKLDEPSLREVKSLIRRIPHKTFHRCMLLGEEDLDQPLDSIEF